MKAIKTIEEGRKLKHIVSTYLFSKPFKPLYFVFFQLLALFFIYGTSLSAQTADVTAGCIPLEVHFTAPGGTSTYFWDFKNSSSSGQANPATIFINPGSYEVTFSESANGPVLGTVLIQVFDKPQLEMASDISLGCKALEVTFYNESSWDLGIQLNQFNWVFGDSYSGIGEDSIQHTYQLEGVYDLALNFESEMGSCNVTTLFEDAITVTAPGNLSITSQPSPPSACEAPAEFEFDALLSNWSLPVALNWSFGNGNIFNGDDPPTQRYNEEGSYFVRLTASDSTGCEVEKAINVLIGTPQALIAGPFQPICVGDTLSFINASPPGVFEWSFSPEPDYFDFMEDTCRVVYQYEGDYSISLNLTSPDGLCSSDTTIHFFVDEAFAGFTSDPTYSCSEPVTFDLTPLSGEAVAWQWYSTLGPVSESPTASYTFDIDDSDPYFTKGAFPQEFSLVTTNPSGCRDTFYLIDTVYLPNAFFMPDVVDGCVPLTVNFTDLSDSFEPIVSWNWDFGDGTTSNSGPLQSHTYTETGVYDVILSIENSEGCIDTSYAVQIEVGDVINPDFEIDGTELCVGESVHFTSLNNDPNIDAWHFETDQESSGHCFQESETDHAYSMETGPVDVTLILEYNGCQSEVIKEDILQVNGPLAKLDYLIECDDPYTVILRDSSLDATEVMWDFGDGETSTENFTTHTYASTGDYWVKLSARNNANNCPQSVDSVLIHIRDVEAVFDLEDKLCWGSLVSLDAGFSQDVYAECWKGYSWYFDLSSRPITTQDSIIPFAFGTVGDETVSLVVEDINGCKDTTSRNLKIYNQNANFTLDDPTICIPGAVNFTDLSIADTTIVSWTWDFNDGSFGSSLQNPSHLYTSLLPDTIVVRLEIEDALGCTATSFQQIAIYEPVTQIGVYPGNLRFCAGETVSFSANDFTEQGSSLSFEWDFGNGEEADTQTAATAYENAGNYLVQLNFTEIATGCENTISVPLQVQDFPIADFSSSVDEEEIICAPTAVQFFDETQSENNLSYFWDFGNGQRGYVEDPFASFDKGTYEVTMLVSTNFGCRDTISKSITLVGPEGDFVYTPAAICLGDEINFHLQDTADVSSFTWFFGDGTSLDNESPAAHTYDFYPPDGNTVTTLILRGQNDACAIAIERPVALHQIAAEFPADPNCAGIFQFENISTGADEYFWDFGNGQTFTDEFPEVQLTAGNYDIQLIATFSELGCADTFTVENFEVFELPGAEIIKTIICEGQGSVLELTEYLPGATYSWQPEDLFDDSENPMPELTLDESQNIILSITDADGCVHTDSVFIDVIRELENDVSWDTIVFTGSSILIPGPLFESDYYQYSWEPVDGGLSCTGCSQPFLTSVQEDMDFSLLISDEAGCNEVDWSFNVIIGDIEIPNAFTPNGDGMNDYFNIVTNFELGIHYEILEFQIFSRWGQLVYENNNPAQGWDGRFNGTHAPSDAYVYVVKIKLAGGEKTGEVMLTGDVTLIR